MNQRKSLSVKKGMFKNKDCSKRAMISLFTFFFSVDEDCYIWGDSVRLPRSVFSWNLLIIRTRSDFEKHLTIKNCKKIFLKIILRLRNLDKNDEVSTLAKRHYQVKYLR